MNWLVLFTISLQLFCYAEGSIIELTGDDFDKFIKENTAALIEFYSPGCGNCKSFAPEYEKLAQILKKTNRPCVVGRIDDKKYRKSEGLSFATYPGVAIYINGAANLYKGELAIDPLLAFINKKLRDPSIELKTEEEIIQKKSSKEAIFILSYSEENELEQFKKIAKKVEDHDFYHVATDLLKKVFPNAEANNVVAVGYGDEGIYKGPLTSPKILKFLETYSHPPVRELNSDLIDIVYNELEKKNIYLYYDPSIPNLEGVLGVFEQVAKDLRSPELAFIYVNIDESWGTFFGSLYSVSSNMLPLIEVFEKKDKLHRYRYKGELTREAIRTFIEKVKKGEVERYIKSEPEPESNDGPIRHIVGSTFNKEVIDNDKDVIIIYYGPMCPKCDKIKKIFENLAEKWKDNDKLVFGELDITKNDARQHYSQVYPLVELFPGKNKTNVKTYDSLYTESEFQKFLEKESSYIGSNKEKSDL